MSTPETEYKGRVARFMTKIAKDNKFSFWQTALGYGAVAGLTDKWYQFGSVPIFFEKKKEKEAPRRLQKHKIKQMQERGLIAIACSAHPDSLGIKGDERKEIVHAILEQLQPEQVDARVLQYACDAKKLRGILEGLV